MTQQSSNMSNFFKNKETIITIIIIIIVVIVCFYFYRKNQENSTKIDILAKKFEEQQQLLSKHDEIIVHLIQNSQKQDVLIEKIMSTIVPSEETNISQTKPKIIKPQPRLNNLEKNTSNIELTKCLPNPYNLKNNTFYSTPSASINQTSKIIEYDEIEEESETEEDNFSKEESEDENLDEELEEELKELEEIYKEDLKKN